MNGSQIYKHKVTGKRYKILHFGIIEATHTPAVAYTPHTEEPTMYTFPTEIWVRPCHEFFDGRFEVIKEGPQP